MRKVYWGAILSFFFFFCRQLSLSLFLPLLFCMLYIGRKRLLELASVCAARVCVDSELPHHRHLAEAPVEHDPHLLPDKDSVFQFKRRSNNTGITDYGQKRTDDSAHIAFRCVNRSVTYRRIPQSPNLCTRMTSQIGKRGYNAVYP